MTKRDLSSLVSMKGFLILVIVLVHSKGFFAVNYGPVLDFIVNPAPTYANFMFFELSGLFISLAYKDRIADGNITFLSFMWRRIKKFYPVYLITNIIILMITVFNNGSFIETVNFMYLVRVFLMMSYGWFGNIQPFNFPAWYLCILMQCYMIWYFVAKSSGKRRDLYQLLLVLVPITGYFLSQNSFVLPFVSNVNGEAYLSFFIGVIFSELISWLACADTGNARRAMQLGNLVSFGILLICAAGTYIYSFEVFTGDSSSANMILVCPAVLFLALYFRPYERFLKFRPFRALGKISFSIYMWHAPVLFLFKLLIDYVPAFGALPGLAQFLIFFVFLILFSIAAYFIFEKGCFHDKKQQTKIKAD